MPKQYAQFMIDIEYERQRKYNAERFAQATPEELAAYEARVLAEAEKLAESIRNRDEDFIKGASYGKYHPSNSASRGLFERVTGLNLPKTVGGTKQVVEEYAGEALTEYRRRKIEAREAKEEAEKAKEEAKRREYIDELKHLVEKGDGISGDDLVELCRALNVHVAPATIGMLRKRISLVWEDRYSFHGKRPNRPPCYLYRECKEALTCTA